MSKFKDWAPGSRPTNDAWPVATTSRTCRVMRVCDCACAAIVNNKNTDAQTRTDSPGRGVMFLRMFSILSILCLSIFECHDIDGEARTTDSESGSRES